MFLSGFSVCILQDHSAKNRCKGKRYETGNNNGRGHGNGKLPVEYTHRTRHERHRNKYRYH